MEAQFDLSLVYERLGREHRLAKGLLRQIVGAYAVKHDLNDAKRSLDAFWDWGRQAVIPNRGPLGDTGPAALMGRAIFSLAAVHLCRAIDTGSEARQRIDIRPAFKKANLIDAVEEILRFRNTELAHYGGFKLRGSSYSDDRAILVASSSQGTYIGTVFSRWNSSRDLALKMASVVDCAATYIDAYKAEKHAILLQMLATDARLRKAFMDTAPEALFFPSEFFEFGAQIDKPPVEGSSVVRIEW